jgi:hypothetical protein
MRGPALAALVAFAACARGPDTRPAVRVLEHHGRWESGYGAEFYSVVGRLRNESDHALAYVKIRVEVIDAAGQVVASTETYNESAEVLTVEVEGLPGGARAPLDSARVKPLATGAEERFRAGFLKEETPPFRDYRVVVLETPAASAPREGDRGP